MSLALPGLVLVAALCHASWNTVARHHAGHLGVLWLGALLGWVAITPIAVIALWHNTTPSTTTAITCLVATGGLHGLYFFALSSAYERGEISVVYPLPVAPVSLSPRWVASGCSTSNCRCRAIPASLPSALVFCRARQVANNHRHVTHRTGDLQLVGDGSVPRSRVSDVARGTYWLCWAWITGARTGGSPAIHSAPSPASSSRVW